MKSAVHYYIRSNGPLPVSFFSSNFGPLRKTVRLSGYPRAVLQSLLEEAGREAERENTPIEWIHHPLDDSLQGAILPQLSSGVFGFDVYDGALPNYLASLRIPAIGTARERLSAARNLFFRARNIHDQQETIYLQNMDFGAADRLSEEIIGRLFGEEGESAPGREIRRFFGAATAQGAVDHIPEVIGDVPARYFLKGRPGTGKSTFLKKIARAAVSRGYDTEIYHCSLDPKSLDLVAVRELGFCILDSTAPHEYFPSRAGDEILDLYSLCVAPGTDEKYSRELNSLQTAYKELILTATACLKEAQEAVSQFEGALPPPDSIGLRQEKEALLQQLFAPQDEDSSLPVFE